MIKYPGSKKQYTKNTNSKDTSKRGMKLEEDINISNSIYRDRDIAVIYKKPTPIQIVDVDYPSRNKAKITEAYFKQASTTDYNGVYKGYYIDFEAKETKNKTLFPLTLLHSHQLDHLRQVYNNGAIAFLLIRFYTMDKTFLVLVKDLLEYLDNYSPKSLSLKWLESNGHEVFYRYPIPCDYISVIETLIKENV